MEEIISLERALRGLFDGELECRDIELVETLQPPVSNPGIGAILESSSGSEDVVSTSKESDL